MHPMTDLPAALTGADEPTAAENRTCWVADVDGTRYTLHRLTGTQTRTVRDESGAMVGAISPAPGGRYWIAEHVGGYEADELPRVTDAALWIAQVDARGPVQ